jgi:hypothetical protein
MFDECLAYTPDKRPKIVCSEKNSKITFLNINELLIAKIRVDGCVIKDKNTKKHCVLKFENTNKEVKLSENL